MVWKRSLSSVFAMIAILLLSLPAPAQVILKPNGRYAVPLRTKSVAADAVIDQQFATTRLTLTFLNETSDRIEADFIYALPPNTLVTSFAYWYGDEKVVARVVEKEEAAAIYAHITERMRDPALVEMVGKRTFRARIFPVMPNSDLKVEMTLVQAMPSDGNGASYTLPLRADRGAVLNSVNVRVRVKADADIAKVTNSIGLPVTHDRDGYRMRLSGSHYRPQQDLRVRLVRKTQPLQSALHAARSSGRNGFFALALTPDRALVRPTVHITGVTTFDVLPTRLPAIKAHQALMLFGRYTGSGPATVSLTGTTAHGLWTSSRTLRFGLSREPNNPAARLWAERWMERLSTNPRNREAVIALSKRFGMPSRFTSWLAVPKAEMKRYQQETLAARIEVAANRLAAQVTRGRENSQVARQLRRQLDALCRQNQSDPREALSEALTAELNSLASALAATIATGQENTAAGRRLYARLNVLCRMTGTRPRDLLNGYLNSTFSTLAHALVEARHSERPDAARISALTRRLNRVERLTGEPIGNYIQSAEWAWTAAKEKTTRDQLFAEYLQDRPDAGRQQKLEKLFVALNGNNGYAETRRQRLAVNAAQEKIFRTIYNSRQAATSEQEVELKRLRQQEDELRARMGDPLISIDASADAQQVIALMPGGEIKRLIYNALNRHWEARFDIPSYAAEGEYTITVVIVLRDGMRKIMTVRYHVDLTPPNGAGRAQVAAAGSPVLRLQLDASEDTARVKALLPWGDVVELRPAAQPHRFFALVPLSPVQRASASIVTFILTDRAHNRTSLSVDMTAN